MKKILFILPCVPYPLTAGGNQAFFNMVEYIRHKMSVSLLLSPENKEMNDVERLYGQMLISIFLGKKMQNLRLVAPDITVG